jgi:hypothetical protein
MPARNLSIDGRNWKVYPSGLITQMDRDEFGLMFMSNDGGAEEVRVTRYSPLGYRSREASLAELSDAELKQLLQQSQPATNSPEAGYRK